MADGHFSAICCTIACNLSLFVFFGLPLPLIEASRNFQKKKPRTAKPHKMLTEAPKNSM
jgi:hypothetical protein